MEIHPFDRSVGDMIRPSDVSKIVADGISIRTGNKVLRFSLTEETVVNDTEALKLELEAKFTQAYNDLLSQTDKYKEQLKFALDNEKTKLQKKQAELDRRMNETSKLPHLTANHLHQGLSVAINDNGGLIWSYKTVYAPKFVGNKRIEPAFAKRLVTPIAIEVCTNSSSKITRLSVRQILGNKKFHHYHSMSTSSDCWGNFKYDGRVCSTPDEMIEFCKEAALLLTTINDMSIGTQNPRGLSRFSTLDKHLIKPTDAEKAELDKTTATNSRNARAGVDVEAHEEAASNVWTV